MEAKTKQTLIIGGAVVVGFLAVRYFINKGNEEKSNAIGDSNRKKGSCRSTEAQCQDFCENSLNGSYNHPYCYDNNGNVIPLPSTRQTIKTRGFSSACGCGA